MQYNLKLRAHPATKKERKEFDREMSEMARDAGLSATTKQMNRDFRHTLKDGLPDIGKDLSALSP